MAGKPRPQEDREAPLAADPHCTSEEEPEYVAPGPGHAARRPARTCKTPRAIEFSANCATVSEKRQRQNVKATMTLFQSKS